MTKTIGLLSIIWGCFLTIPVRAQDNDSYRREIADWQAKRIQDLKAPTGWLNLVGLYWLDEGQNSFGSGRGNKIVFPAGSIAELAGSFDRSGNRVELVVTDGVSVTINGKRVKQAIIYDGDSAYATCPLPPPQNILPIAITAGEKNYGHRSL